MYVRVCIMMKQTLHIFLQLSSRFEATSFISFYLCFTLKMHIYAKYDRYIMYLYKHSNSIYLFTILPWHRFTLHQPDFVQYKISHFIYFYWFFHFDYELSVHSPVLIISNAFSTSGTHIQTQFLSTTTKKREQKGKRTTIPTTK